MHQLYATDANARHLVFFFKQNTAYEMRISDWSSDVCSSDLTIQLRVDHLLLGDLQCFGWLLQLRFEMLSVVVGHAVDSCGTAAHAEKIGRASGRERVCQYV